MIYVKVEAVPPEDKENFDKLKFEKSNKVLLFSINLITFSISIAFGVLMSNHIIPKNVFALFLYYLVTFTLKFIGNAHLQLRFIFNLVFYLLKNNKITTRAH